jgi:ABC-type glycerol-3-phosphate transport system substrate-binding protein
MSPTRGFRSRAAALAAALALSSCSSLKGIPGASAAGDYLQQKTVQSATKVGENAATAALTGEFDKTASFTMEQEFYLGKTIAATVVSRVSPTALPPDHPAARYLRDVGTVPPPSSARRPTDRTLSRATASSWLIHPR